MLMKLNKDLRLRNTNCFFFHLCEVPSISVLGLFFVWFFFWGGWFFLKGIVKNSGKGNKQNLCQFTA